MHRVPEHPCWECIHYYHEVNGMKCAGFPEGIPAEICHGEFDHVFPYPADRGYRFVLDVERAEAFRRRLPRRRGER